MITGKGATLVFSDAIQKRLSISPFFSSWLPPDPKRRNWEDKVEQDLLQLNRRIRELEKKQNHSSQTEKLRVEADVKVNRFLSSKVSASKQSDVGTQFRKCSCGTREGVYFSPSRQKSLKLSGRNKNRLIKPGFKRLESHPGVFSDVKKYARSPFRPRNISVNTQCPKLQGTPSWPRSNAGRLASSSRSAYSSPYGNPQGARTPNFSSFTTADCNQNLSMRVKVGGINRVEYSKLKKNETSNERATEHPKNYISKEDGPDGENQAPRIGICVKDTSVQEYDKDDNKRSQLRQLLSMTLSPAKNIDHS